VGAVRLPFWVTTESWAPLSLITDKHPRKEERPFPRALKRNKTFLPRSPSPWGLRGPHLATMENVPLAGFLWMARKMGEYQETGSQSVLEVPPNSHHCLAWK
jgi:hypothetical protein